MNHPPTGPPRPPYIPPPPGRQLRPRRKSLEQLEAKYKALMQNMFLYQILRKRNPGVGADGADIIITSPVYRTQQARSSVSASVSSSSSTEITHKPPQKRLQSGPKPAYERSRPNRGPGRNVPAAIQLAYEELVAIQQQQLHQPQPQQHMTPQHNQEMPIHMYPEQQYIPAQFEHHQPPNHPDYLETSYPPHQPVSAPYDANVDYFGRTMGEM